MKSTIAAGASGLLFGVGLVVARMTRPDKVLAFLDVTGPWDPSLAFVMMGAIAVHLVAYRLLPRLPSPLSGGKFALPTRTDVDLRLVAGAALFGIGWGIGGYCPGPSIVSLGNGTADALLFFGAMLTGMSVYGAFDRLTSRAT